jgi:long-chain acyl-CoA synthetase
MGYMDEDKYLYVIGRFKSLLISSDGEKYSPEGIEESIVEHCNHIDQVILHNNQNPYTVALVVPQYDTIKRHLLRKKPTIDLKSEEAKQLALEMIQHDINQFKKGGKYDGMYPERWLPAAIAILPEPMTEQNGLVNSTMKVMRNKVVERYADRLDTLYAAGGKNIINKENLAALNL